MATQNVTPDEKNPVLGENTVLTLIVPYGPFRAAYQKAVTRFAPQVKVPGFRQGKAPKNLIEDTVGKDRLTSSALEGLVPALYSDKIKEQGIVPLVEPSYSIKEMDEGKDVIVEAVTAVAPKVTLGDYKKIITKAAKDWQKDSKDKPADSHIHEGETPEQHAEHLKNDQMRSIFQALITEIAPKVAPMLIEKEIDRQFQELLRQLKQMKVELPDYLKATGKKIEELEQDYAGMSIASLQLEFVLLEITKDLKIEVTDDEVKEYLGPEPEKLEEGLRNHLTQHAKDIVKRRKTVDKIMEIALS